jgi:hypothetical protein
MAKTITKQLHLVRLIWLSFPEPLAAKEGSKYNRLERKEPGAGPQATQELGIRVSAPRLRFARYSLEE